MTAAYSWKKGIWCSFTVNSPFYDVTNGNKWYYKIVLLNQYHKKGPNKWYQKIKRVISQIRINDYRKKWFSDITQSQITLISLIRLYIIVKYSKRFRYKSQNQISDITIWNFYIFLDDIKITRYYFILLNRFCEITNSVCDLTNWFCDITYIDAVILLNRKEWMNEWYHKIELEM